jgi:hypothetical protein
MHIHPNNQLALASLGAGREELSEIQARRAAEVRKKLSSATRILEASDGESSAAVPRVDRHAYEGGQRDVDDEAFPRLFSAKA